MHFVVLSLFPSMFEGLLAESILRLAQENALLKVDLVNFRDYTTDKHRKVDDRPYGGGPGMVLKVDPIVAALEDQEQKFGPTRRVLMTPQGTPFRQSIAADMARETRPILLVCGHYEGFDERVRLALNPEEISLGDFVLSGGEVAAMAVIDAVTRLLPGALGGEGATLEESFTEPLLEYPQYTRPAEFRGLMVPEVLKGGNHKEVAAWRRREAILRTKQRRPDLMTPEIEAELTPKPKSKRKKNTPRREEP